jgi:hypothetical protein
LAIAGKGNYPLTVGTNPATVDPITVGNVMSSETPLAVRLLNAFEHYYRENAAFRTVLTGRRIPGWERELQRLMNDHEVVALVRDQFSAVRSALTEESDPAQGLQQLLAVFPPNKDVN